MGWAKVATLDDLWSGEMLGLEVQGRRVLVLRIGDQVRAYEDRCVHQGVPLSQGCFDGRSLVCRAHEWTYDALTGAGKNPRSAALTSVLVEVHDGDVFVQVPDP